MADNQHGRYDPAEAKALENRIWKSINAGDAKSANSDCEALNTKFPTFASGWHTASHLLIRLNKPRSALDAIDRALQFDSRNSAWLLQRAVCLSKLNRISELSQAVQEIWSSEMRTSRSSILSASASCLDKDEGSRTGMDEAWLI